VIVTDSAAFARHILDGVVADRTVANEMAAASVAGIEVLVLRRLADTRHGTLQVLCNC